MEFARLKTIMFVGIIETSSQGWTWKVATRVTYITNISAFLANFKKGWGSHIGYISILLSLMILSITPNASMIQPSKI